MPTQQWNSHEVGGAPGAKDQWTKVAKQFKQPIWSNWLDFEIQLGEIEKSVGHFGPT